MKTKLQKISKNKLFYLGIILLFIFLIYILIDSSGFVDGFNQGLNPSGR
ncbi:MAG: hypothetical protein KAS71_13450 [Bacteroidales bacterium]|nr:hypothetical protein [Bacteroidales bacterium]